MTLIKKEYRIIFLHITPRSPNDSNIVTWPTVLAAQKKHVDRPVKIPLTQQPILFIFYYSVCQDNQSPTIMSIANRTHDLGSDITCQDQVLTIMLKTIANSKDATLLLNQVHHASVMLDHDSDLRRSSLLINLVIGRMFALPNILCFNLSSLI